MMLKYTIGFIKRGNEILMLNRNSSPDMGKWNGVGGKFEEGETPLECIIRETYEETGIRLKKEDVIYSGAVTWASENGRSGMYAFITEVPHDFEYTAPIEMVEGILCWKKIQWVCDEKNLGVVGHVPHFLPKMLSDEKQYEHRFFFSNGTVKKYEQIPLSDELTF
ncbi:mutT/nudix family protein [Paenibacillus vortex V453]|uniref:MutT/nudix family protein n=1 Tax=Paenibacillus vortex V453 TaxID=715225 RepID=A0A2R9T2L4_9BACL|nr:8-oxo-dGTP diphosphatase [Paenibacillus vortex]EFU43862.1 mutT/nudix family protein [Paenibacillus vortex V453]